MPENREDKLDNEQWVLYQYKRKQPKTDRGKMQQTLEFIKRNQCKSLMLNFSDQFLQEPSLFKEFKEKLPQALKNATDLLDITICVNPKSCLNWQSEKELKDIFQQCLAEHQVVNVLDAIYHERGMAPWLDIGDIVGEYLRPQVKSLTLSLA